MKILVLSDLHIEFADCIIPEVDADVVLLAGDIHIGEKGFFWAKEMFKNREIIYVIGNHEYYHGAIPEITDKLQKLSKETNIHILENEALMIGDVRFLGCTLWSDFRLLENPDYARRTAGDKMNDYRLIRLSPEYRLLEPSDTKTWNHESVSWLEHELTSEKTKSQKTVVITHHAPSLLSVPERVKHDPLSAAFASEMIHFIFGRGISLWVHGHVHDSFDYQIGKTRVLCNPRGYIHQPNPEYNPELVVEI